MKDCDYCRNAHTCEELSHENDLSYISCGSSLDNIRMLFRSGNKQVTSLLIEELTEHGYKPLGYLVPHYCPFCGRELLENKRYLEKGK